MTRAVVVGARRVRQGIGPFVARTLVRLGVEVAGVVGSTRETAEAARADLASELGRGCSAHTALGEALDSLRPDVVAVCSPIEWHAEHVGTALDRGVHVLCEKPFVGAARAETARGLVERARSAGVHLSLLTQWPEVLGTYGELFPGWKRGPLRSFRMWMAPSLKDRAAIVDVGPHPISVLQAAVGPGRVREPRRSEAPGGTQRLEFDWVGPTRTTRAELELRFCPEPPRPAGLGFDGNWAAREVDPESYAMRLGDGRRSVPLPDPLQACVRSFLERAARGAPTDGELVLEATAALDALATARDAESS